MQLDALALTDDGFLIETDQWSWEFALYRAEQIKLELTEEARLVVESTRTFYLDSGIAPANRALLKIARVALANSELSSIDLIDIFSDKPALNCARLAGIPRPKNCF